MFTLVLALCLSTGQCGTTTSPETFDTYEACMTVGMIATSAYMSDHPGDVTTFLCETTGALL